ncbi:pachytene checkpoint component pch2 [Neofusicoccum parvum]|uniref:Pachytene checkpoint component pch2 n=1 Tax=Neofusicoccum parvum TaxID=310453 RepID=A0ACB5SAC3_9PEZI|nr:pachytene checkpoint component pch2 [Neofusicoccum parvum]
MARNHTLNTNYTNWNGVFLLHGPPGGGKTTLCRGLAQKLKIRLGKIYTEGEMIELNPGALFSKYFGESGKIVGQVFDKIQNRADTEEETLFCLMIDEVETLVSPRERSASGGEVADAMRVTNCILTALDRLRRRPNVMLLCTSNMIEGIDSAFLDRVDMVQFVPNPEPSAVYSILQSSLNELIKQGFLLSTVVCAPESQHSPADTSNYASRTSSVIIDNTPRTSSATGDTEESRAGGSLAVDGNNSWKELDECSVMMEDPTLFPSFAFLDGLMAAESSLAMKLWNFSKRCHGMSGRSLRRLPSKAVGLYTYSDHPSISEALQALQMTLDNEKGITSTT